MIQNPLFLQIILEILPKLLEDHKKLIDTEKLFSHRIDIFDKFFDKYFSKEKERLDLQGAVESSFDVSKELAEYAKTIALYMSQRGGPRTITNEEIKGIISNPNIRSGILHKKGLDSFSFFHTTFFEYFVVRAIFPKSSPCIVDRKNLGKYLLTDKFDIIKLFAETISDNQTLQQELFQIIKDTRKKPENEPAAKLLQKLLLQMRLPF